MLYFQTGEAEAREKSPMLNNPAVWSAAAGLSDLQKSTNQLTHTFLLLPYPSPVLLSSFRLKQIIGYCGIRTTDRKSAGVVSVSSL